MFGISTEKIIEVVKKVLAKIASWIWDRFKDWLSSNWQKVLILAMGLIIVALLKILFAGLSFSSFQRLGNPETIA